MALVQQLATEWDVSVAIGARGDGAADFKRLATARDKPVSVVASAKPPSRASRAESKCVAWEHPLYDINNAQLWRAHLIALSYVEGQINSLAETAAGRTQLQTAACASLRDFIGRLRKLAVRWHGQTKSHEAARRSTAPLWKELRKAGDAVMLNAVQWQVYDRSRGTRATRSSRRAAFQQSPYSYKSTKFKGKFATGSPLVWHEPQFEPLSDEVSSLHMPGTHAR